MATLLIVEDDKQTNEAICEYLKSAGHKIVPAFDGVEALKIFEQGNIDLVILDIMLPKLTGLEVCQQLREFSNVPVIMLTAKGGDMDKILGLEYGADDYITKPFNILEVKARIKAIIRRNNKKNGGAKRQESSVVTEGDLKLDRESRRVFIKDKEINLTAKEFDLLELLVTNPNKVYRRC